MFNSIKMNTIFKLMVDQLEYHKNAAIGIVIDKCIISTAMPIFVNHRKPSNALEVSVRHEGGNLRATCGLVQVRSGRECFV